MIVKEKTGEPPGDKYGQAGYKAEQQMAFYLRRAFGESSDIFVFNDLRFVRNGEVAQIDHLILHRFGLVSVESKSVTGSIEVNAQQEFVRVFGRKRSGMKSPITQVNMQKQLLQSLLNDHKEQLRRKVLMGIVQAQFSDQRFHVFVAISDQGEIKRRGGNPPELVKADRVTTEIQQIYDRRAKASGFGGMMRQLVADKKTAKQLEADVLTAFTDEEINAIQAFLIDQHTTDKSMVEPPPVAIPAASVVPPPPPPTPGSGPPSAVHSCRHCQSGDIEILHGQYGYYFKCRSCIGNTRIDFKCPSCGGKARISKNGPDFKRICSTCGTDEQFFTNA